MQDSEIRIVAEIVNKDGVVIERIQEFFNVSAQNIDEAKKIAINRFNKNDYNRDFDIVEVLSKEEFALKYKKADKFADGGEADELRYIHVEGRNEDYAIKDENGWVLGYRGSSSEIYFSPHTMPITFPSEKLAQEFIDRNATKNPFIQKGIIVKLFADGGGVGYEPITKPKEPVTKPKEKTGKPDKDSPYKPKGIPKPKASRM
jgi:hypothetical protein